MTAPLQTPFNSSTANGVTTVFPYTFKIEDDDDIGVLLDGVLQVSGYTVSGAGNVSGGNVTFSVAPASSVVVLLYRKLSLTRETDYQQFGDWLAENVNPDFDRAMLDLQVLNALVIRMPEGDAEMGGMVLPSAAVRATKHVSFDASGALILTDGTGTTTDAQLVYHNGETVASLLPITSTQYATLQAACDAVPNDGDTVEVLAESIIVTRPIKITKRQTQLRGQSYQNTFITLQSLGADRGAWLTATAYVLNDIVTVNDLAGKAIAYVCDVAHTSGTFATDLAAGKWQLWCAVSVRTSDVEISGIQIIVPAKAAGIAVQGAARADIHGNAFRPSVNNSGYAILLSDEDYLGAFSGGSYTHKTGSNLIGVFDQGVKQFAHCIIGTGTSGGMNNCEFRGNHMVANQPVYLPYGGGNRSIGNLYQSQTGANSGSRPFTGGVGYAVQAGGEFHSVSDYIERYDACFRSTSAPSAKFVWVSLTDDACNDVLELYGSGPASRFGVSGYGVESFQWGGMDYTTSLTGNNQSIDTSVAARRISGGGAARTGIYLASTNLGAGDIGREFTLYNDSWGFELVENGTANFNGGAIIIGQAGTNVGVVSTQCSWARFRWNGSKWDVVETGGMLHGAGKEREYSRYSFSGNNETMTMKTRVIEITGAGAARTGALFANGKRYGETVRLFAQSWSVAFAAGAAAWSAAGAPTMGNGAGQVQMLELMWTGSWFECNRTTRA